jgi:hypothetical protein
LCPKTGHKVHKGAHEGHKEIQQCQKLGNALLLAILFVSLVIRSVLCVQKQVTNLPAVRVHKGAHKAHKEIQECQKLGNKLLLANLTDRPSDSYRDHRERKDKT